MKNHVKIWHTSDWHLGKKFYGHDLLVEQELFLSWLLKKILEEKPEILLICGDIFDSPRPPTKAMALLWSFFADIKSLSDTIVLAIGGNHDSGSLLEAPEKLINDEQIILRGELKEDIEQHKYLYRASEFNIDFTLLPYFRNQHLFNLYPSENDEESLKKFFECTGSFYKKSEDRAYQLLLAHHLYGDFMPAGSELPLLSSGLTHLSKQDLGSFFDYVALGHIHRRQVMSKDCPLVLYCGAPLPFRFSESGNKSLTEVSVTKDQMIIAKTLEVPKFRKIYSLSWNEDNAHERLSSLVNSETDKEEELVPFVEVNLQLKHSNPKLTSEILQSWPHEKYKLINLKTNYEELEKQDSFAAEEISVFDLFKHYIEKKDYSEKVLKEIEEDFMDLSKETTEPQNQESLLNEI